VALVDVNVVGGRAVRRTLLRAYGDPAVLAGRLGGLHGVPPDADRSAGPVSDD